MKIPIQSSYINENTRQDVNVVLLLTLKAYFKIIIAIGSKFYYPSLSMKKYIIVGIPCLIAIIVASIYSLGNKSAIQYKTANIDTGAISKYVTATGTINPVRTVLIGSQVTGLISQLYVDFNSVVKVGQVVAQIDPVPFEHQVKRQKPPLPLPWPPLKKQR